MSLSLHIRSYSYVAGRQHEVIGYEVLGLPADEFVTINNAEVWEKPAVWKIVYSKSGFTKELEGEYRTAEEAFAAFQRNRAAMTR